MIPQKTARLLAAGWTFFILAILSLPGGDLPEVDVFQFDKLIHFFVFAVFGWLWLQAFWPAGKGVMGWVIVGGVVFAGLSEIYQGFLPFDRSPDLYDVFADGLGILFSVILFQFVRTRRKSELKNQQIH